MNNEGQDPLSILKRLAREIEDLKSYQITDELNNQATAQSNLQNSFSFGYYDSETERRKNFQSTFYRILNDDGDLSDMDKISQIIALKDSYSFFPFAFINLIREIKSNHYDLLDENKKEIVIFLKNYFQNPRVQLTSKFDGLSQSTDFVKNFFKIIRGYNYQIRHDLASPPPPPPPRDGQASNKIWSDFDLSSDGLQNSSQPPSPHSSQGSIRSSSPPPPPPQREKPVILKFSSESLLPLPIFICESNESSELGIAVTSQVVPDKADSQEANQVISAIIVAQQNQQEDLLPLPKRLDLDGDQLPQQNIDSTSASVVLSNQNQEVDANDLAMQDSTASSQGTFPMPQRLGLGNTSEVSSIMLIGVPVVPDNQDSNGSPSDAGSEPSSNSGEEKLDQDESGKKKTRCFGCCVFSRVRERITGYISEIKMGGSLKFFSASCLGSSRNTKVGPGPPTP